MLVTAIIYFVFFVAMYSVSVQVMDRMRNRPPSPFPALPIIGHLYAVRLPFHRFLRTLEHRHGDVVLLRMGSRKVLSVSSPAAAEECLTTNDVAFASRPRLFAGKHVGYNYTSFFWAPYGDHWRNLRRISSLEILSVHRIQALSYIRAEESRTLLRRLADLSGEATNMHRMFHELTMNVIMRMIAGTRIYGVSEKAEKAKEFQEIVKRAADLVLPYVGDFVPIAKVFESGRKEKNLIALHKRRDDFMQSLIEDHRNGEKKNQKEKCMVEVLVSLQDSEPEYYSDQIIRGFMVDLLAAGTDTTAGTMEWVLANLLNSPEAMKKTRAEIDEIIGNDRLLEESDLPKLPYLHRVVRETLRLYPVGPMLLPHESTEDCKVKGYNVPRGTMLLVNLWSIQRDPKLWEDPDEFKPERHDEEDSGTRDGFKMWPFGSGRRSCPGENFGMRIVKLNLGLIVQCFDWAKDGDGPVDMTEGFEFTLPKAQKLIAKCRLRPCMAHIISKIVLPK